MLYPRHHFGENISPIDRFDRKFHSLQAKWQVFTALPIKVFSLKTMITHDKGGYHGVIAFKSIITERIVSSRGFSMVRGFLRLLVMVLCDRM
jgi:hypothetical protein